MKTVVLPSSAAALVALLAAASAPAQQPPDAGLVLTAHRAATPPVLDGRLDDDVWAAAPAASAFVQARPSPGAAATERTEVRVAYDGAAVYVAARMHDGRPDSVVGRLARRDQDVHSDWFSVAFDSHHDRRSAFVFAVNPRGVTRDLQITGDASADAGWDAVWSASVRTDSLGWTAELRIPLSQLRFRAGGETWGVNFERRIARRDEVSHWAPLPPDGAGVVSRYGTLAGLRGLRAPSRLELLPYTVARVTRAPGDAEDPYHRPTHWVGSAGADLKYGLGSELTLAATLNPDFGQVEADPSQVNLTGFETYFAEKRPFFTEGAELFDTGRPQLFYSRRIGRAPSGAAPAGARFADVPQATTILGAVKLTGRTRGWSIGVLNAVTADERARFVGPDGPGSVRVEPLANYAVARLARDFRGGRSGAGVVLTSTHRRLDAETDFLTSSAYAGGVDARHRVGVHEVSGAVLGSWIGGSDTAVARVQRGPGRYFQRPHAPHLSYDPSRGALGGYAARLAVERVGGGPWRWRAYGHAFSPGFEVNDAGFHFGADELRQDLRVGYHQHRAGAVFRRWAANLSQGSEWTFGGERMDAWIEPELSFQLANHWSGFAWYMRHAGGTDPDAMRGGPGVLAPPRHMAGVWLRTDPRRALQGGLGIHWMREDGTGSRRLSLAPLVLVRPSERLEASLQPSVAWNRAPWQYVGRRADAHAAGDARYVVARLEQATASLTARVDYAFSPALSLQLYASPFASAGDFGAFRELADPRAAAFDARFRPLGDELRACADDAGRVFYGVRARRAGCGTGPDGADFAYSVADPDFTRRQFRSNAVVRWEYRPGSTLFVAWSSGRRSSGREGRLHGWDDALELFRAPGTNVLLVKLSYWMGG